MPADSRTIRLLLLEDNPDDAFLLKAALNRRPELRFEVVHVERLSDAIVAINEGGFDVAITDLSVPDSIGVETVKRLVQSASGIPVFALTGWEDPALGSQLIEEGAFAYWSKDRMRGSELPQALARAADLRVAH